MNSWPLLDALDIQADAAQALDDDLRAQIDDLQTRLREAEMHLERLTITRRPSPGSPTGSPPSRRTCPSTRTTPDSGSSPRPLPATSPGSNSRQNLHWRPCIQNIQKRALPYVRPSRGLSFFFESSSHQRAVCVSLVAPVCGRIYDLLEVQCVSRGI